MGCQNSKSKNNNQQVQQSQQQQQQQKSAQQQQESQTQQGQQNHQQQKQNASPQDYINQGLNKVNQMKDDYEKQKQEKWLAEVIVKQTDLFIEVNQWFELYEPKSKGKAEKRDKKDSGPFSPEKMMKKIAEGMKDTLTETIMKLIAENGAKAIEMGATAIKDVEPKLFSFLNSIIATLLTFRFEKKDEKKFQYFRGLAVDRMAFTFVDLLEHEATKLDKATEGQIVDQNTANQIIDKIVALIYEKINEQKEKLQEHIKKLSVFQVQNQDQDIAEGIQAMIDGMQQYGEKKLEIFIQALRTYLPDILNVIAVEQQQIRTQFAIEAQNQGYEEPSEEYIQKVRGKMMDRIERYHNIAQDNVNSFVTQFVNLVVKMAEVEEVDEPEN